MGSNDWGCQDQPRGKKDQVFRLEYGMEDPISLEI